MVWGFCYLRIFKKVRSISGRSLEKMFSFREASASFQAEHFFVRIRVIGLLVTSPANGRSER
jgi:hypothetical protein